MSTRYASSPELLIAGRLLMLASVSFSRHGCNDNYPSLFVDVSHEERERLEKEYNLWNCPAGADYTRFEQIPDWAWMRFLASKVTFWEFRS
jgi:hypothetical protein